MIMLKDKAKIITPLFAVAAAVLILNMLLIVGCGSDIPPERGGNTFAYETYTPIFSGETGFGSGMDLLNATTINFRGDGTVDAENRKDLQGGFISCEIRGTHDNGELAATITIHREELVHNEAGQLTVENTWDYTGNLTARQSREYSYEGSVDGSLTVTQAWHWYASSDSTTSGGPGVKPDNTEVTNKDLTWSFSAKGISTK